MNFIESFNNKTILIPRLQRDYVQSSRESAVISPFLDVLLGRECDLNYIYGYEENGCFVPIDGQQRLTTLWLLYLYLYAKRHRTKEYRVFMKFASRPFASDFCERLHEHIESVLDANSTCSLDKAILDQNWFILSWVKNATVSNMLSTLKLIHQKINDSNFPDIWKRLVETSSVTFAFLQMDENNGLDDDIYIKMNGRGRKLSEFENLKSWMDEKVSSFTFAPEWKNSIDNAWTNFFWENRNLEQAHPEEIDNEQLFFFYNLLILYHIKNGTLEAQIAVIRENKPYIYEELQTFLGISNKVDNVETIDCIIERLLKAGNIPLVWIERIGLMPDEFFNFAYDGIRRIVSAAQSFNGMDLNIGENQNRATTPTYQICMCEGHFDRTLPLFFALLSYQNGQTSLFDWMRIMRNLILGTSITKENIGRILKAIHSYSVACSEKDIYELLSTNSLSVEGSGFNRSQFEEEIHKSSWIVTDREWINLFTAFENISFCRGTIGFVFNYLPKQKDKRVFKEYSTLFHLMFGISGVRYNITQYNLQRSLMCFTSHYGFGYRVGDKRKFMNSREEWLRFLNDTEEYEGLPHNHCMKLLAAKLYDSLKNEVNLIDYNEEYNIAVNSVMNSIIVDTLENNKKTDWRYFFIKYPSVWDSMGQSMCRWINDYDIYILGSTQWRNGNIRELRSFAFWKDIMEDAKNNPEDYKSWNMPNFWYCDETCMFIEHKCANKRIVAIDVFFERGKTDQYCFRIFYRTNENENKEAVFAATRTDFVSIATRYSFNFIEDDHRYWSGYYSYEGAFELFKKLIRELEDR